MLDSTSQSVVTATPSKPRRHRIISVNVENQNGQQCRVTIHQSVDNKTSTMIGTGRNPTQAFFDAIQLPRRMQLIEFNASNNLATLGVKTKRHFFKSTGIGNTTVEAAAGAYSSMMEAYLEKRTAGTLEHVRNTSRHEKNKPREAAKKLYAFLGSAANPIRAAANLAQYGS